MQQRSLLLLWGRQLVGLGIISVVLSLLSLAQPLYMLNLYDRVLSSQSHQTLIVITMITVFVIFCYGLFDWVRSLLQKEMGSVLGDSVRPQLLEASVRLAAVGADGGARLRLTKLEELKSFVTSSAFASLFDLVFVPVYFTALYLFHPLVFVVCIVLALGTVAAALIGEWSVKTSLSDYWVKKSELRDQEAQLIRNAAETVTLGRIKASLGRLLKNESEAERVIERAQDSLSRVGSINKTVTMLIQTIVLGVACYLVLQREVSVGVMFAVNIVATRAMQPLFQITSSFRSLAKAADGWREISNSISKYHQDLRATQPISEGILRVRSLTVLDRVEDRKVLSNIHMDVDPGELVVVTGDSGAGKSTLLRAVVGLIPDYVGSLELDHRELKHWRLERESSFIGFLPQNVNLFSISIAENITGELDYDHARLIDLCKQLGLHEDIGSLKDGYETVVNSASPQFSGGQIRLIGLARALWGGAKILVLDEPTSGLDVARERLVVDLLKRHQAQGTSVLVATHSNLITRVATKILWLKWGQTKGYGFRDDVLNKMSGREAA